MLPNDFYLIRLPKLDPRLRAFSPRLKSHVENANSGTQASTAWSGLAACMHAHPPRYMGTTPAHMPRQARWVKNERIGGRCGTCETFSSARSCDGLGSVSRAMNSRRPLMGFADLTEAKSLLHTDHKFADSSHTAHCLSHGYCTLSVSRPRSPHISRGFQSSLKLSWDTELLHMIILTQQLNDDLRVYLPCFNSCYRIPQIVAFCPTQTR